MKIDFNNLEVDEKMELNIKELKKMIIKKFLF